MKKIIVTALLVSICAASCNTNGSTSIFEGEKTAEELRLELKAKEESNPGQYMAVHAEMKDSIVQTRSGNFFRRAEYAKSGSIIKGSITNSASLAKFKDAILMVSYYSATETEIKSEDHILYDYYGPNAKKKFSIYVHAPKDMKSFNIIVKTATPVN
jgi:hypothetical protein